MANLAAVAGSEVRIPLPNGFVMYCSRVTVAADGDTFVAPLSSISFAVASMADTTVAETDIAVSVTWATNIVTFNDQAAGTVAVFVIGRE